VNERLQTKWLDTGENVLSQLQIVQIQHTYVTTLKKKYIYIYIYIYIFGLALLKTFPA
jgi:hypothetical protein